MADDISDGICVYLTGGLGNQLFGWAAGLAQARRLSCPLYLDTSDFGKSNSRDFGLSGLVPETQIIGMDSPWRLRSPRETSVKRKVLNAFRHPGDALGRKPPGSFTEAGFAYDERIGDVVPGTTLLGYFQSPLYFDSIAGEIHAQVSSWLMSRTQEAIGPANNQVDVSAAMHVRRGDYTDPKVAAFHGMATSSYFERATALMQKLSDCNTFTIYSDDITTVLHESELFKGPQFLPMNSELDQYQTMKRMSMHSSFVMSNSSFSWWAAWLMTMRQQACVIAPRPWFRSGEAAADLLLPDWITLDAR